MNKLIGTNLRFPYGGGVKVSAYDPTKRQEFEFKLTNFKMDNTKNFY